MSSRSYRGWTQAGWDAWMLGAEASTVVGLRMMRIAKGGDTGSREAALMVSEKIEAGLELQGSLIAAGLSLTPLATTQKALRHYGRKVAANKRRLSSPGG